VSTRNFDDRVVKPAIKAYPTDLARTLDLGGESLSVRAIRPEDAPGLVDLVARCDIDDVRLRFRSTFKPLPETWAVRLSQLDYDRDIAFAAVDAAGGIVGVSHLFADPQGEAAEFALLIRTDHQHHGLGRALMEALISYAKASGFARLWGEIEARNCGMLALARDLGFTIKADADFNIRRATLELGRR